MPCFHRVPSRLISPLNASNVLGQVVSAGIPLIHPIQHPRLLHQLRENLWLLLGQWILSLASGTPSTADPVALVRESKSFPSLRSVKYVLDWMGCRYEREYLAIRNPALVYADSCETNRRSRYCQPERNKSIS